MAKLSKDNYIKLEKAISLLESISKDITITSDMEDIITNASDVISSLSTQFSYERSKPFVLEEKHLNYLDSIREQLTSAEKIVDDIKNSKQWKKVINYFNSFYTSGKLTVRPTKKNGYVYEVKDGYFNQKELLKDNVEYLEKNREELVKAEKIVTDIKTSKEWKKTQSYFLLCDNRGLLEYKPTKENRYTVKAKEFSSVDDEE
jgi:cysteinyl-tRNA synthetase